MTPKPADVLAASPERLAYTIAETARVLGVSRTTIWELRRKGLLKAVSIPGTLRPLIRRVDIETFLKKHAR